MADDKTEELLLWLQQHVRSAHRQGALVNGVAASLVVVSILSSFAAAITAAFSQSETYSARLVIIILGGLPGVCLTVWKQFPFDIMLRFQNTRYIIYREIYFALKYGNIELSEAVKRLNAAGRELRVAFDAIPAIGFPEGTRDEQTGRIAGTRDP